ncbi:MAG: hypothetical protein KDB23_08465 [Planctomycetales bacterium]|nr:hypothetical protein [Planctomycetales bacterium]
MKNRVSTVLSLPTVFVFLAISVANEPPIASNSAIAITTVQHRPIDTETYRNQVVKAYVRALQEKKFTLVLFSKSHHLNPFAQNMMEKLKSPRLAEFADQVIMCMCDPELDSSCSELQAALKVTAYPSLFVIKTHREKIEVMAEIVGECELEFLERTLRTALAQPIGNVGQYAEESPELHSSESAKRDSAANPGAVPVMDSERFRDHMLDAYMAALEQNKYTLVLLTSDDNGFAQRMERKLKDPQLSRFAEHCVLAVCRPNYDEGARKLADKLEVKAYPHLLVLNTNPSQIHIVGEIIGEVEVHQIEGVLQSSMTDANKVGVTGIKQRERQSSSPNVAPRNERNEATKETATDHSFSSTPGFTEFEQRIAESLPPWSQLSDPSHLQETRK